MKFYIESAVGNQDGESRINDDLVSHIEAAGVAVEFEDRDFDGEVGVIDLGSLEDLVALAEALQLRLTVMEPPKSADHRYRPAIEVRDDEV